MQFKFSSCCKCLVNCFVIVRLPYHWIAPYGLYAKVHEQLHITLHSPALWSCLVIYETLFNSICQPSSRLRTGCTIPALQSGLLFSIMHLVTEATASGLPALLLACKAIHVLDKLWRYVNIRRLATFIFS